MVVSDVRPLLLASRYGVKDGDIVCKEVSHGGELGTTANLKVNATNEHLPISFEVLQVVKDYSPTTPTTAQQSLKSSLNSPPPIQQQPKQSATNHKELIEDPARHAAGTPVQSNISKPVPMQTIKLPPKQKISIPPKCLKRSELKKKKQKGVMERNKKPKLFLEKVKKVYLMRMSKKM